MEPCECSVSSHCDANTLTYHSQPPATRSDGDVLRDRAKPSKFTRDEEDYGRHRKLSESVSARASLQMSNGLGVSYLKDHANGKEAFVLALLGPLGPPLSKLEAPSCKPRTRRRQRLECIFHVNQLALCAADQKKLLVLRLKESDSYGQVEGHDPELQLAWDSFR